MERAIVRVLTLLGVSVALLLPAFMGDPKKLPSVALGSTSILYIERAFAVLILFTLVLTLLTQGVLRGAIPLKVTKDGIEWQEVATTTSEAIEELQRQIDSIESDLEQVLNALTQP